MKQLMHALLLVYSVATVCTAGNVRADELVLNNGERLLGTLTTMQDKKLSFESDMLGPLSISMDKVRRIAVGTPRETLLADGTVVKAAIIDIRDTNGNIELPGEAAALRVQRDQITAISPPPPPKIVFSGNISTGIVDTHGSSSSTKANLDARLTIRTARQRLNLDARWFYGREKDDTPRAGGGSRYTVTDRNYSAGARYDYFITKKIYSYLGTRYKRDTINDLKYRLVNSTGLGYQWVETTGLKFSTDAGLAQYKEKYISRVNNPLYVPGGTQPRTIRKSRRVDALAWQAGTALDWRINSRFGMLSQARYTQSFEDSRDYFLTTETELRLFLTRSFYSNLKTIFEYDNTPGADSSSTETKYIFGLGWSF